MNTTTQSNFLKNKNVSLDDIINKHITIVGMGGLGTHLANSIIRMGFVNIRIIDGDVVERSNLSRQILFDEMDIGKTKVSVAVDKLLKINPNAHIETSDQFLDNQNTFLLFETDIILDGTDNLEVRHLINNFCFSNNIPWIQAAAIGSRATSTTFIPGSTPCYKCLVGDNVGSGLSCSKTGILSTTLMSIVSVQVNELIKVLSGSKTENVVREFDFWEGTSSKMDFSIYKNDNCDVCCNKNNVKAKRINIICDGSVKDLRTKNTKEIEYNIPKEFSMTKSNKMLTEYVFDDKRIVVYNDIKVSFYNFKKETILKLCA